MDFFFSVAKDLITHLLCVNPAQRYSIDEFLAHPWCNAAPAPPPPPTPYMYPHKTFTEKRPLDSPLRGPDGRSPGINMLKEAFDVTYAVHRMEEERARRRMVGGRHRVVPCQGKAFLAGLNEDDEEEEEKEEEDAEDTEGEAGHGDDEQVDRQQQQFAHWSLGDGRAGQRDQGRGRVVPTTGANPAVKNTGSIVPPMSGRQREKEREKRGRRGGFELDMDNATLLGRRQKASG